jgi:uncharacterized alkaline shock family protein YloU
MMTDPTQAHGKTTIAPEVLVTIARLTALSVPGVHHLAATSSEMERFFNKNVHDGIKIAVENDLIYIDIYVVLNPDTNVRETSHAIQAGVSRAISEMVGMEIGKINIHIEDIHFPSE